MPKEQDFPHEPNPHCARRLNFERAQCVSCEFVSIPASRPDELITFMDSVGHPGVRRVSVRIGGVNSFD